MKTDRGPPKPLWWLRRQPLMVRLWSDRILHLLGADEPGPGAPPNLDIRINDWTHLERFEQVVSWYARERFLADCRSRIEKGILIFTLADAEGPLLAYGTAQPKSTSSYYPYVDQTVVWPERTATIYGGFVHPAARGRGLHAALQRARIRHLIETRGTTWVISGVSAENQAALRSAHKTNLRPVADLRTRSRLGVVRKSAVQIESAFNLRLQDALG